MNKDIAILVILKLMVELPQLYQINTKTRHINRFYFPITALKIISIVYFDMLSTGFYANNFHLLIGKYIPIYL